MPPAATRPHASSTLYIAFELGNSEWKLVTMLLRADAGERNVWRVVHVPTPAEEDRRQVHRELLFARRDRGRHTNRVKGLLAAQGVPLVRIQELETHLETARLWDGTPL